MDFLKIYLNYNKKFGNNFAFHFNMNKYLVPFVFCLKLIFYGVWAQTNDLIPFRKGNLWGFADKTKKIVIECKYDEVFPFHEGVAFVKHNNSYAMINSEGKAITAFEFEILDLSIDLDAEVENPYEFINGYAIVKQGKFGVVDKTGHFVISPIYDCIEPFKEGLAAVCKNYKWGFINEKGKEVVPVQYDEVKSFNEGYAAVRIQQRWGFIDKSGREVINLFKYDNFKGEGFNEGLAAVSKNGKYGFIDKMDFTVIPFNYDWAYNFHEGLATVKIKRKQGAIDQKGNLIIPAIYDEIYPFSDGIAKVDSAEQIKYINKTGAHITHEAFEDGKSFSEGLAAVRKKGKWGFIDIHGKMVILPKYDDVKRSFHNGLALVEWNGKLGYIDKSGKEYWVNQ